MKRGFTLLEILIVLAILGILCGLSVAAFVNLKNAQTLDRDTDLVVESLRQARSQTLTAVNDTNYGIHFSSNQFTLFAGSTYDPNASTNKVFNLNGSKIIVGQPGFVGFNVVFGRLSGETDQQTGQIMIQSPSGTSRIITLYKTGLVEFQ